MKRDLDLWHESDFKAVDEAVRRHNLVKGMDLVDVMPSVQTWPQWHRETFLLNHKGHVYRWALFVFFVGNGVTPELAVELIENEDWSEQQAKARGRPELGFIPSSETKQLYWKARLVSDWMKGRHFENPRSAAFPNRLLGTDAYWPIVYQKQRGGPSWLKGAARDGSEDRIWKE